MNPILRGMPRITKVLGQRFAVVPVKDLSIPAEHVDHGALEASGWQHDELVKVNGLCNSDEQVILLETEQGFDRLREVYLHEHLHAIMAIAGLRDTIGPNADEVICKRVAPILLDFLRSNPRVVRFLVQR